MFTESAPYSRNLQEAMAQGPKRGLMNQFTVEGPKAGTITPQGHLGLLPVDFTQFETESLILEPYSISIPITSIIDRIQNLHAPEHWKQYDYLQNTNLLDQFVGHYRRNIWPTMIILVGSTDEVQPSPCANLYVIPGISPQNALTMLQEKLQLFPR